MKPPPSPERFAMRRDHRDVAATRSVGLLRRTRRDHRDEAARTITRSVSLLRRTVKLEFRRKAIESLQNVQSCGTLHEDTAISVDDQGIPLRPNDIQQMILAENGWLNDEMINRAMNFLNKKHPLQQQCGETISWDVWRAQTLQTFWFTKIENGEVSLEWMTNWMNDHGMTKGKQPQLNCVIIPCFHNSHWTLTLVFPLRHKIAIVDSLVKGAPADRAANVYGHICKWLHAHMDDDFDKREWTLVRLPCPQQENSHDCGVHVILNAWFLSKGIWPMAHKDITPGDRRLFVAYMVKKGTRDSPMFIRREL